MIINETKQNNYYKASDNVDIISDRESKYNSVLSYLEKQLEKKEHTILELSEKIWKLNEELNILKHK